MGRTFHTTATVGDSANSENGRLPPRGGLVAPICNGLIRGWKRGFNPSSWPYRMQMDAADAFDISRKPETIRDLYSWHPPLVLLSPAFSGSERFTETGANMGSLGVFESKYLIRLMQANARIFDKFGA